MAFPEKQRLLCQSHNGALPSRKGIDADSVTADIQLSPEVLRVVIDNNLSDPTTGVRLVSRASDALLTMSVGELARAAVMRGTAAFGEAVKAASRCASGSDGAE